MTARGAALNVQFRWLKVNDADPSASQLETWNLFYLSDGDAVGAAPAWRNIGQKYVFDASGQMSPQINAYKLTSLKVDGAELKDIQVVHGLKGLTQYSNQSGTATLADLDQDGYPAGELAQVAINEDGRIVSTYTNGESREIAEVAVVTFRAANKLRKLDGGAYAATTESGAAVTVSSSRIVGQAIESSNSDIADEFSKLIVTQQAYSAGARVVSVGDELLREAINIIR